MSDYLTDLKKLFSVPSYQCARTNLYAIYIVPRHKPMPGNQKWKGLHITLCGFHKCHPELVHTLKDVSNFGRLISREKCWKLPKENITRSEDGSRLTIKSKTLDFIANKLKEGKFLKVKHDWHITYNDFKAPSIEEARAIFSSCEWDLVKVRIEVSTNEVLWQESEPLFEIEQE